MVKACGKSRLVVGVSVEVDDLMTVDGIAARQHAGNRSAAITAAIRLYEAVLNGRRVTVHRGSGEMALVDIEQSKGKQKKRKV